MLTSLKYIIYLNLPSHFKKRTLENKEFGEELYVYSE